MPGYSKRPLIAKLGIEPGMRLAIVAAPAGYEKILGPLPEGTVRLAWPETELAFVHYFARSRADLEMAFAGFRDALIPSGMLWISWPKRASGVPTDLTENVVREIGLAGGLVDVKVAAIDATWSGLKFVYRLRDRPG